MIRLLSQLIITSALLASCATLPSTHKFSKKNNITFTPQNWPTQLVADQYKPSSKTPTPAVLLIHGGGWTKKERRGDMTGIAKQLASRGYFVMNTTYRLTPQWQFPTQKEDIDLAIKYLRQNAISLNIDPDNIATFGYSAGGHLAALSGLDPNNKIKAIVAGGAPTDLTLWPEGRLTGLLLGGPLKGNEKKYISASPAFHVTKNSPPTFIYHGTADTLVPVEHAQTLIQKLQSNNIPHQTYWINNRSHIVTHLFSAKAIPTSITFLDQYMDK